MPRPAPTRKKSLTAGNLADLGADRLSEMLIAVAASDANWRRRLRLELAAEAGAEALALELDKRLVALGASRARISWRKRPELIEDLRTHLRMIVDRLTPLDARMGLDRLVAWFDLHPALSGRVKDPKGEVTALFLDAGADMATVASAAGSDHAVPILFDALQTRLADWAGWMGRAAPDLARPVAEGLTDRLTRGRPRPSGRLALVVRRLADRAGNLQAWIDTLPEADRLTPDVGAEIARRLAAAGRVPDARAALEAARPRAPEPSRWTRRPTAPVPPERSEAWDAAEIAVLDAEGRADEAQTARWAAFERGLSPAPLRDFLSRLADFEDVVALDRAHAVAAAWPDARQGLAFLMDWPALREAAAMVTARHAAVRASPEILDLWISRLAGRYPLAALLLVRGRALALARQGLAGTDAARALAAEAATLAEAAGPSDMAASHAAFIDELDALSTASRKTGWR